MTTMMAGWGVLAVAAAAAALAAVAEGSWCIAATGATAPALQSALDYACGAGADCAPIQPSGPCYLPNTLAAHCSYAFNSYYQRSGAAPGSCIFAGAATLSISDPSYGSCTYPSSPSSASGTITPGTGSPNAPGTITPAPPGNTPPSFGGGGGVFTPPPPPSFGGGGGVFTPPPPPFAGGPGITPPGLSGGGLLPSADASASAADDDRIHLPLPLLAAAGTLLWCLLPFNLVQELVTA